MTLRIFLTVFEIALLVGVLATFLNIVAKQLNRISANLARIARGASVSRTSPCFILDRKFASAIPMVGSTTCRR